MIPGPDTGCVVCGKPIERTYPWVFNSDLDQYAHTEHHLADVDGRDWSNDSLYVYYPQFPPPGTVAEWTP